MRRLRWDGWRERWTNLGPSHILSEVHLSKSLNQCQSVPRQLNRRQYEWCDTRSTNLPKGGRRNPIKNTKPVYAWCRLGLTLYLSLDGAMMAGNKDRVKNQR